MGGAILLAQTIYHKQIVPEAQHRSLGWMYSLWQRWYGFRLWHQGWLDIKARLHSSQECRSSRHLLALTAQHMSLVQHNSMGWILQLSISKHMMVLCHQIGLLCCNLALTVCAVAQSARTHVCMYMHCSCATRATFYFYACMCCVAHQREQRHSACVPGRYSGLSDADRILLASLWSCKHMRRGLHSQIFHECQWCIIMICTFEVVRMERTPEDTVANVHTGSWLMVGVFIHSNHHCNFWHLWTFQSCSVQTIIDTDVHWKLWDHRFKCVDAHCRCATLWKLLDLQLTC